MDRLERMQIFVRVVELKSFTRAADDLQLPRATVSHAIAQLEERLGAHLIHRTTRQVRPTEDGLAFYQQCLHVLAEFEEAEASFSAAGATPKGKLRVDMHGHTAANILIPALPDFFARYPHIRIEIGTGDRQVDLVREGVDCVLRGGQLSDSTMIAKRLTTFTQVTCASPDYLARHGTPQGFDDLAGHTAVQYFTPQNGRQWPLEFHDGDRVRSIALPGHIAVSGTDAYIAACLAGFGIIQLPRHGVQNLLAQGRLVEILSTHTPPPMPISLLYPQHKQRLPRLRVFAEWVSALFADL